VVSYSFIQHLQIDGVGTAPNLTNYIQKNVDIDISAVYTFDSSKLYLRSEKVINEVAAKSYLIWSMITSKPTLFSGDYNDLSNKPTFKTETQGLIGPQGPIGLTGLASPQGPKGDKGDTGAQGPIGPARA